MEAIGGITGGQIGRAEDEPTRLFTGRLHPRFVGQAVQNRDKFIVQGHSDLA